MESSERQSLDASRKVTACTACRKRKVRCHMIHVNPPCTRCKTRGLSCIISKSSQTILEDDLTWKETITQRIDKLEKELVAATARGQEVPVRKAVATASEAVHSSRQGESATSRHDTNDEEGLNLTCSLGSFPASSLTITANDDSPSATSARVTASTHDRRALSSGQPLLLDNPGADQLFAYYRQYLDPLIHYVLGENDSYPLLQSRSPLLATTICTVASYCSNAKDYNEWRQSLMSLIAEKNFTTQHSFDDVRALCIGSFWLSDLATLLSALAVRCASELNLHRCMTKMPFPKRDCYDRTRLYLLVYVIDHLCSLCYGRPPMVRELQWFKLTKMFLQDTFSNANRGDLSLVSQVELWANNASIFDTFGADIERDSSTFGDSMNAFSILLDTWYKEWLPVLSPLTYLLHKDKMLPSSLTLGHHRIFDMYMSAGRLYLCSHAFRGSKRRDVQSPSTTNLNVEINAYRTRAVSSALGHLRSLKHTVISAESFTNLPAYLRTTTAFSSVFLLRILKAGSLVTINEQERTVILGDVKSLCEVLEHETRIPKPPQGSPSLLLERIIEVLKAVVLSAEEDSSHVDLVQAEHQDVLHTSMGEGNKDQDVHTPHGWFNAGAFLDFEMSLDDPLDLNFGFFDESLHG